MADGYFLLTVGHENSQQSQPIKLAATKGAGDIYSLNVGGSGAGGSVVVTDSNAGPAQNAEAVTPGAGALSNTTRALYVGGAGNITVTMAGGGSVSFAAVPAGTTLPIAVTHVTAATATSIVALW